MGTLVHSIAYGQEFKLSPRGGGDSFVDDLKEVIMRVREDHNGARVSLSITAPETVLIDIGKANGVKLAPQ